MKRTAVVFTAPNHIELRLFDLPTPGPSEVLVRTHYSMVPSGTELRVMKRQGKAKQQFPLILGYSLVGEVVGIGPGVTGFRSGDLVSGLNSDTPADGVQLVYGGHQSHHVFPVSGYIQPVLLPDGVKALDYAPAETAAISLRGAEMARPQPGETAVVIGQGLIGAFSAAWLQSFGCRVVVTDTVSPRLASPALSPWGWPGRLMHGTKMRGNVFLHFAPVIQTLWWKRRPACWV